MPHSSLELAFWCSLQALGFVAAFRDHDRFFREFDTELKIGSPHKSKSRVDLLRFFLLSFELDQTSKRYSYRGQQYGATVCDVSATVFIYQAQKAYVSVLTIIWLRSDLPLLGNFFVLRIHVI